MKAPVPAQYDPHVLDASAGVIHRKRARCYGLQSLLRVRRLLARRGIGIEPVVLSILLVLFALPTGLFLAFSVPLGSVPDEPAHVARIESLLHGELFGQRRPGLDEGGRLIALPGVVINAAPFTVTQLSEDVPASTKITTEVLARLSNIPWAQHVSFVYAPNTAVYFPIFYLPGTLGLALGRLDGLTPFGTVLAARIVNLGSYIFIAVLALVLARRGRRLIFATLTLPTTLWLAASCNEDGLLIACSCLAAALLTQASGPRGASYWGAGALLACVIAVKPAYLPLMAFLLLPCRDLSKRELLRGTSGMVMTGLPGIIWAFLMLRYVSGPFIWGPPYHPGPLWPGNPTRLFSGSDPAAQMSVFLHHPLLILTLPLQRIHSTGLWYLHEAVGVLGNLDLVMSDAMFGLWFTALGLACLGDFLTARQANRAPLSLTVISLISVAAAIMAIFDLQYLSWTKVGTPIIEGVQGRYALPLLPMMGIALPSLHLRGASWLRGVLTVPTIAAATIGIIYLPALVVETYYLH